MKIRTFIITFVGMLLIVASAGYVVVSQTKATGDIDITMLEDRLYAENITIMSWFMGNVDPAGLATAKLPASWGEVMLVDNDSLAISASSNPENNGTLLYENGPLLDQAEGVIGAIKSGRADTIATADYMVAVQPVAGGKTVIGIKPKTWEKSVLQEQNDRIASISCAAGNHSMIFIAVGVLLALVVALIVALITAGTSKKTIDLFDSLSMGQFDVEVPGLPDRDKHVYYRLKTSLMIALERLGEK